MIIARRFGRWSGLTCLLFGLSAVPQAQDSLSTPHFHADRKDSNSNAHSPARLWREPLDLEQRDLFYGIGGADGAPDPAGRFTFIRRQGSATDQSEKFVVKDERDRKWVVKLGPEARPETAATRLVWAAGYHTDHDYFVKRAHINGRGGFDVWDARFERDDDGFHTQGRWSWTANPFINEREFQGLRVLMALLGNWDLSEANNKIISLRGNDGEGERLYYVNDLGASLGRTGGWLNRLPPFKDQAVPGSRGDAEVFAAEPFIEGTRNGEVVFHWRRKFGREAISGITVENARWMGNLLGRLSDKQLADAFRAGGFTDAEVRLYVGAMRDRIRQLQSLK